nr:ThuA domain-containing protein [Hymenobacter sp. DG25B]
MQSATVRVTDTAHPATNFLPALWQRTDEWYNFRDLAPDLRVLATLDETTYNGGTHGADHPIVWCHAYDGGRAFYTAGAIRRKATPNRCFAATCWVACSTCWGPEIARRLRNFCSRHRRAAVGALSSAVGLRLGSVLGLFDVINHYHDSPTGH